MGAAFFKYLGIAIKMWPSILTCIYLIFLTPTLSVSSDVDPEQQRLEEKRKLEIDIKKQQINIERLQRGMMAQKEGVEHTILKEKGILAEIEDIDTRLLKTAAKLQKLQERTAEQKQLIEHQKLQIETVKAKLDKVQAHLEKRMVAYYKLGKIDLINIAFSTQTLPQLLKFHDAFQTVIK